MPEEGSFNGRSVVLVHGIGSWHAHFDDLCGALVAAGFRCVAFDLWGRGHSEAVYEHIDPSLDLYVEQLRAVVKLVGLAGKPYSILAHSMGGAILWGYLAKYLSKQEVEAAIAMAPAGLLSPQPLRTARSCCFRQMWCFCCCASPLSLLKGTLLRGQESAWRDDFVVPEGPDFESMMRKQREVNEQRGSAVFESFFADALHFPLYGMERTVEEVAASPHLPRLLFVWGEQDKAVPFSCFARGYQRIFAQRMAEGTVTAATYANGGHGAFLELKEQVHKDVLAFLVSPGGAGGGE